MTGICKIDSNRLKSLATTWDIQSDDIVNPYQGLDFIDMEILYEIGVVNNMQLHFQKYRKSLNI